MLVSSLTENHIVNGIQNNEESSKVLLPGVGRGCRIVPILLATLVPAGDFTHLTIGGSLLCFVF